MMNIIIDELNEISLLLREGKMNEAYGQLAQIIPDMSKTIDELVDENTKNDLVVILTKALGAMENNDGILLADTIQHEMLDALSKLL